METPDIVETEVINLGETFLTKHHCQADFIVYLRWVMFYNIVSKNHISERCLHGWVYEVGYFEIFKKILWFAQIRPQIFFLCMYIFYLNATKSYCLSSYLDNRWFLSGLQAETCYSNSKAVLCTTGVPGVLTFNSESVSFLQAHYKLVKLCQKSTIQNTIKNNFSLKWVQQHSYRKRGNISAS